MSKDQWFADVSYRMTAQLSRQPRNFWITCDEALSILHSLYHEDLPTPLFITIDAEGSLEIDWEKGPTLFFYRKIGYYWLEWEDHHIDLKMKLGEARRLMERVK